MKPTHPVELLVCAIATQEGELKSHTRNNPGNLRYAHQAHAKRPDGTMLGALKNEPIAVFDSWADGIVGLFRDAWAKVAIHLTVREFITQYAPEGDHNDTEKYIQDVLAWTGLPEDTPIVTLLPDLTALNVS
jgi:hypothetical protein